MPIKKLSAIAALCAFHTFASPVVADEASDLKEMLLKQQKQIELLNKKIERQESVHNEALTHYIKNEIDRSMKEKGSLLTLGSHIENLEIKGDLRVRYQNQHYNKNAGTNRARASRDRFRQRFRLGFKWKTSEGWEIGAGFATGGADATSTNQTYSSGGIFATGDLRIDYAYAKHKFDNGITLTIGQHKNPFVSSKYLWDGDIRPVGITVQYNDKDSGFFGTIGGYQVLDDSGSEGAHAQMFAAQVGIEKSGFTAALAYYHMNSETTTLLVGDATESNDVKAASAYLEYAGKTDSFKYKVYGEYTMNFGADNSGTSQVTGTTSRPESEDTAWVIGGEIGVNKFKFKYAYVHFGSDAFLNDFTDSDFGDSVGGSQSVANAEGHAFGLGYKVTKNFSIGVTYIISKEVEHADEDRSNLLQVDLKYKF